MWQNRQRCSYAPVVGYGTEKKKKEEHCRERRRRLLELTFQAAQARHSSPTLVT